MRPTPLPRRRPSDSTAGATTPTRTGRSRTSQGDGGGGGGGGFRPSPGAGVVSRVALLCGFCLAVLTQRPVVSAGPLPSAGGGDDLDANLLVDTRIEAIGMCRVLCLKKFSLPSTNRSKPKPKRNLEECWKRCEDLFRNPSVYLSLCNSTSDYCMDGCQVACTFQRSTRGSKAATNRTWTFGSEVQSKTDNSVLTITWDPPTPSVPVPAPHPIVYTLLLRENDDAWRVLTQTSEDQYKIHTSQALWVPSFVLQAVDDTGIIASRSFDVKGFKYEKVYEVENIPLPPTLRQHEHLQAKVNVSYALSYDVRGGLGATLTWTHPSSSSSKSLVSGEEELLDYELVYIMYECGIHQDRLPPDVPVCNSPKDLFDAAVPFRRREKAEYTISELLFSSRYIVTLSQKLGHKQETVQLARLVLETPFCPAPSLDYLFCDHPPQLLASPPPPPPPTSADDVSVNVTQASDVAEEPPVMELELIRDLRLELLPLPEAWSSQPREWGDNILGEADEYLVEGEEEEDNEGERERLLVNVTWTYISDVSQVNFSLTLQLLEEGRTLTDAVEVSGATHVTAALLDNAVYEIVIELIAPPETKGESGALFHSPGLDQTKNYIYHSRQVRVFNTSELRLAASERHQAVRMSTDKSLKAVNGAIIGVTCVGTVLAVTVLGLLLYKKRQSFKDIIVPKTTVAKSNSYKSSVGVKTDYSNQLMVFCDEWELDPQQLKFSTPLGQGAFGKVVTGYYMDHRVAIKLVKEGAPLSYKEDLVAEINLMKRLGSHPNIVCLVGACTVSEPIALVMEYVPFGNLQNFLKKCRLEGDLQKREDGPSEIQYSVLQDCGGIENGVITPTDMLSFARQVAMAMEYLVEKKYVHRDLAARNVLLHFNKVVKVCDFGLSRDIFNDNQYKKLTNGKLPLKWMAIESLRDRIFTTHSDVWSFGILLWEIVTMGASPYPSIALADLYYVLSNHYRMGKPSNCSNELYGLMRSCWAENPLERPTFTEVRERLEELMAEDRDYLILEDIDVPLSASESSSNPTVPELFSGELLPSHAARQVVTASLSCSSSSSFSSNSGHTDSASSVSAGLLRSHHLPLVSNVAAAGLAAGSGEASCAGVAAAAGAGGGVGGGAGAPGSSSSCGTSTATTSTGLGLLQSGRRPPMTIDVCVHQKSTERLVRPSESDSSP